MTADGVTVRVQRALEELRAGRMLILVDDEDRENEGDLVCAGELVSVDTIRFMMEHARGEFCLALSAAKAESLNLSLQVPEGGSPRGTAFTVTIDARAGGTGVSAADRALTCTTASRPQCRPEDLIRPGHIHPLRARDGGVLVRTGHTEGSVDLMRLAGLQPAALIIEVVKPNGDMARLQDLEKLATAHGLTILSIADLVRYRLQHESLVKKVADHDVMTRWGPFRAAAFEVEGDQRECLALIKGDLQAAALPTVRVHSGAGLADIFPGLLGDGGERLDRALAAIQRCDAGVLLYIPQEQHGLQLGPLLRQQAATSARGEAFMTPAGPGPGESQGMRHIGVGAQVLRALGLSRVRLMSNNPVRLKAIQGFGLEIVETTPLP